MQALHDAILDALLNGGVLSDEMIERLMAIGRAGARPARSSAIRSRRSIQRIIERLTEQGYIVDGRPAARTAARRPGGQRRGDRRGSKSPTRRIDFLGYRALRDLLGSMGRSSAGRHDTREPAPASKPAARRAPYEFGDTMNLDATATVLSAVQETGHRREG